MFAKPFWTPTEGPALGSHLPKNPRWLSSEPASTSTAKQKQKISIKTPNLPSPAPRNFTRPSNTTLTLSSGGQPLKSLPKHQDICSRHPSRFRAPRYLRTLPNSVTGNLNTCQSTQLHDTLSPGLGYPVNYAAITRPT